MFHTEIIEFTYSSKNKPLLNLNRERHEVGVGERTDPDEVYSPQSSLQRRSLFIEVSRKGHLGRWRGGG